MSEKIEINTMITKHENKCKDCRFDMIDVEDPLWEYGNPLKRVLIDNQTGETYDSVSKLVGLLNEQQSTIEQLQEENKELKHWKKRMIEYLTDWFNKTDILTVLYKIAEITKELGFDSDE